MGMGERWVDGDANKESRVGCLGKLGVMYVLLMPLKVGTEGSWERSWVNHDAGRVARKMGSGDLKGTLGESLLAWGREKRDRGVFDPGLKDLAYELCQYDSFLLDNYFVVFLSSHLFHFIGQYCLGLI